MFGLDPVTYHKMPQAFARDPIENFWEHVFIAPFYEDPVEKVIDLIGANRVLFGSDWPHPEGLKKPLNFLDDIATVSDADKKLIMHSNLKGLLEGARD